MNPTGQAANARGQDRGRGTWIAGLIGGIAIGAASGLFCGWLHWAPIEKADWWARDFVARMAPPPPPSPELLFLALDESSLNLSQLEPEEIEQSPALSLMAKGWPFSRAVYAHAIRRILEAGARVVAIDVSFPLPGNGDAELAGVIAENPGRVVLASVLDRGEGDAPFVTWPSSTLLEVESVNDPAVGYANFFPDIDGVVRSAVYETTLSEIAGRQPHAGESRFPSLAASTLRSTGREPLIPPGNNLMRFAAPGAFPKIPLWSVFVPALWESNLKNGGAFRDRIVLLGPDAPRFADNKRTPLDPLLPGPELHLNALSSALTGNFLAAIPPAGGFAICLGAGLLAGILTTRVRSPLGALGFIAGLPLLYLGGAWVIFSKGSIVLPLVQPSIALFGTGLFVFAVNFSAERKARSHLRKTFERYVSREIVREIIDNPASMLEELGGTRKDLVVLFSDLRGFTSLSETAKPEEIVSLLNQYLGRMVDEIFSRGGTVDKFIGDAVMAVWGAVASRGAEMDAVAALRAAQGMLQALAALNENWSRNGAPVLKVGIGIHCGPAIFGNIGSDKKMEPGVIGDTVNLASRLEGLSKKYGVPVIVSGEVAARAASEKSMQMRHIDTARVAGRSAAVEIYSPAWDALGMPLAGKLVSGHQNARALFVDRKWMECARILDEVLLEFPDDGPSVLLRERVRFVIESPPGAEWSPVMDWTQK